MGLIVEIQIILPMLACLYLYIANPHLWISLISLLLLHFQSPFEFHGFLLVRFVVLLEG
jgi:hypothetical protein